MTVMGDDDRTSWKAEVSFMAGPFEAPAKKMSHTAHTNNYVSYDVACRYAHVPLSAIPLSYGAYRLGTIYWHDLYLSSSSSQVVVWSILLI